MDIENRDVQIAVGVNYVATQFEKVGANTVVVEKYVNTVIEDLGARVVVA